ncbi:hypothetical protein HF521_021942 [Silurus meridionalis]|uniref:LIM zinc-binding domain-containing protein n=1 Tax=Silurus meridionalis TaxID=175797 RepID=A0A8T0BHI5_SILME|nr:hypothetical protein HF521_021942 [Silurus meridionalis]
MTGAGLSVLLKWETRRAGLVFPQSSLQLYAFIMSSKCLRCEKPVYFAEKVSSLGKNWHRFCLKCERCNKILSPGGHAEHDGLPYCNKPCYATLADVLRRDVYLSKMWESCVLCGESGVSGS